MDRTGILSTIVDADFYESFDYYQPKEEELLDVVKKMLPTDWQYARNGVWFGANPPDEKSEELPIQGWKIHISSSVANAENILKAVVPILERRNICFKFALDMNVLQFLNSKQWSRQGAGKFITIYPVNEDEFKDLIEELHQATRDFQGLYILSDRRYKDSKVVFYRYGGIRPYQFLNVRGAKTSMLLSPEGQQVPDQRRPFFIVPEWTKDPFEAAETPAEPPLPKEQIAAEGGILLKEGRYLVKSVLGFSNSGGVYIGEDRETQQEVVIKEARPYVNSTKDSMAFLKKEYRILSKIAPLRVAPQPVDFFQDWEHTFLVQEYLKGPSLASFSARNNLTLYVHPSHEQAEEFYRNFKKIFSQVAEIVRRVHECGVVLSDLSPNNIIVLPDLEIKLIDFEGAHELGVDAPVFIYTPGFAYKDQMNGAASDFASDYFSLGASMHYFLAPVNQIFLINPKARFTFIESVTRDIGFPKTIFEMISSLIDKDPEKRLKPKQVVEILERDEPVNVPRFATDGPEADHIYQNDVQSVAEFILSVANYERKDRLFPADNAIFGTNPLSLAHGACGVAWALNNMLGGKVPETVTNWILQRNKHRDLYPPNLYMGLSGIAWAMLELGFHEEAQQVLSSTNNHPLLHDAFDVFCGVAGWGMANLRFFMEFQNEEYLQRAIEAGDYLLEIKSEDEDGCYWKADDEIPLGYAHGASGVSVFLLYLYLASGQDRFLDVGTRALDFDLSHAVPNLEDGLSWKASTTSGRIMYPYWRYGAAGVGAAVLRYYYFSGEEKYSEVLEKILLETNRKYSVFPGYQLGITGLGEFLLDMHQFTDDSRCVDAAYRIATGVSLFRIERKEGVAFPGDSLQRISCDLMTGSAGVGHFFHRLVNKTRAMIQVDQLLNGVGKRPLKKAGQVSDVDQERVVALPAAMG